MIPTAKHWLNTNTDPTKARPCHILLKGDPGVFSAVTSAKVEDLTSSQHGIWKVARAVPQGADKSHLLIHISHCTQVPRLAAENAEEGARADTGDVTVTLSPPIAVPPETVKVVYASEPP